MAASPFLTGAVCSDGVGPQITSTIANKTKKTTSPNPLKHRLCNASVLQRPIAALTRTDRCAIHVLAFRKEAICKCPVSNVFVGMSNVLNL
jgi:hypothetical protein